MTLLDLSSADFRRFLTVLVDRRLLGSHCCWSTGLVTRGLPDPGKSFILLVCVCFLKIISKHGTKANIRSTKMANNTTGMSFKTIGRQMGYHYTVFSRLVRKHTQTNNVKDLPDLVCFNISGGAYLFSLCISWWVYHHWWFTKTVNSFSWLNLIHCLIIQIHIRVDNLHPGNHNC
jgi:hypothetical protein